MTTGVRSAEDVIERHIAGIGGRELLQGTRSIAYQGAIQVQGTGGRIESAAKAPNRAYQKIDLGVLMEESGFDGAIGWKRGTKGARRLSGEELVHARESAIFNRILLYRDPAVFSGIRLVGESRETPAGEYVLELILASGNQYRSWFDAETFVEVKRVAGVQTEDRSFEREVWFTDYRELDGRQVPYGIRQVTPFNEVVISIHEYQVDTDGRTNWWDDVSQIFAAGG